MPVITISKELFGEKELVVIPRKKYREFVNLQKIFEVRTAKEQDVESAVRIYKREKRKGKLKIIRSLAELD